MQECALCATKATEEVQPCHAYPVVLFPGLSPAARVRVRVQGTGTGVMQCNTQLGGQDPVHCDNATAFA